MKTVESEAKLTKAPKPPKGVKYALSVPQSVLSAELECQAYTHQYIKAGLQIDYEMNYIIIDTGGAMSWNYDSDQAFNTALIGEGTAHDGIKRFIVAMGTTSRKLLRRSELGSASLRRPTNVEDLIQDLANYWQVRKLHMTSLCPFWNVEQLLIGLIDEELKRVGMSNSTAELGKFMRPAETNQFARERRSFKRLVKRFAADSDKPSTALVAALRQHANEFNFLLTPYNLAGDPQTVEKLLARVAETRNLINKSNNLDSVDQKNDSLDGLPYGLKQLALTARDLTFWKNERLDSMSLADALVAPMYQAAADILQLPTNELFAMTAHEITQSLLQGTPVVSVATRAERQVTFCLVQHNGKITFYQPSNPRDAAVASIADVSEVHGIAASEGIVTGRAAVILKLADLKQIQLGDVLITPMTRPEYGVALDRAAAFVTDEGGLLCHAAIISREMKKPCVIATGTATNTFITGDMVEVDGSQGIVKKII